MRFTGSWLEMGSFVGFKFHRFFSSSSCGDKLLRWWRGPEEPFVLSVRGNLTEHQSDKGVFGHTVRSGAGVNAVLEPSSSPRLTWSRWNLPGLKQSSGSVPFSSLVDRPGLKGPRCFHRREEARTRGCSSSRPTLPPASLFHHLPALPKGRGPYLIK